MAHAALIVLMALVSLTFARSVSDDAPVISGPRGLYPYLFKRTIANESTTPFSGGNDWSLLAHRSRTSAPQRLHIIAFMVEFNGGRKDTTEQTTGNGLFNINLGGTKDDTREYNAYDSDTVYPYDNLDHYQAYFNSQFEFVKRYFNDVSFGKLSLSFELYPDSTGDAYAVDNDMVYYSPGGKKRKETWDDYYYRKTKGLVHFVKDAVIAARDGQGMRSPFAGVYRNAEGHMVKRDSTGTEVPVAFLIIHAGASYLTDGGESGVFGQDSPSDMIDAFVYDEFFSYFTDSLEFDTLNGHTGVKLNDTLLANEFMMVSETSNQDGLNWGIHGIIVNQIARQLGIPDLYSTSSGISGIGAFGIMDFAGYSAANGFIPPWPSAWVRAYMGWDTPVVVPIGGASIPYSVKAIGAADSLGRDTTILLIPINDHEYYLIENRQRNLDGDKKVFNYDTTENIGIHISSYPYNVNIPHNVIDSTGRNHSNVILKVRNYDVGLPASGLLVWHVDEEILRGRLEHNMVNADSLYRGVSLVEADGIDDLGITFQDAFYQAAFDYGGAEDVFPHTSHLSHDTTVQSFGPKTRPSTRSNDGGNSFLTITVNQGTGLHGLATEKALVRGQYLVSNFAAEKFTISVSRDYLSPGWPQRIAPDSVYEPAILDLIGSSGKDIALLDHSGRLYLFSGSDGASIGSRTTTYPVVNLLGDTLRHQAGDLVIVDTDTTEITATTIITDSTHYLAALPSPAAMPSVVNSKLFVPSRNGHVYVLSAVDNSGNCTWDTLSGNGSPFSTCVCNFAAARWAVGTMNGTVLFGSGTDTTGSLRLDSRAAVNALAALPGNESTIAAVQANGTVSLCSVDNPQPDTSVTITTGIAPYKLATGDLDRDADSAAEIIVVDSRQGVWVLSAKLAVSAGWDAQPNPWAGTFSYLEEQNRKDFDRLIESKKDADIVRARRMLPENPGAPALADINRDGRLDILVGGTNGVYAFNYKGVLVAGWPYYLDNRFWFQRGSITTSPIIGQAGNRSPLVLFSSPTGDRATYAVTQVDSTNRDSTKVFFTRSDGTRDSLFDLSRAFVDSILVYNGGLIAPYVLPGGYIDAITPNAKRPIAEKLHLPNTGAELFSNWPLTAGSSMGTAPVVSDLDNNGSADLVGVAQTGWVYRWELSDAILRYDPNSWSQTGFDGSRSFTFGGPVANAVAVREPAIDLYSFPNPTDGSGKVVFRYKFSGPAKDIKLDIFTYTGHHVYSWRPDSDAPATYPDWNEHMVSIKKLGPAVYRCRLGATVKGKKVTRYWKMAVVR